MNCDKEKIGKIEGMDEYMNYKKITLNSQFSIASLRKAKHYMIVNIMVQSQLI